MRVLHVWNTAGVASLIAKTMDGLYGTQSTVMTRKSSDRVGFTKYGTAYEDGATVFFVRALAKARSADLVHVHALDRMVPWLKRLYPGKPVVLQYLGTDIKGRWNEKEGRWRKADLVGYCTPNLSEGAPSGAIYVPIPVDTDAFYPRGVAAPNSALSFRYGMEESTQEIAKTKSLDLTLLERLSVPHGEMPALFSRFEYYIDLRKPKGHDQADSIGKAALEALASGCRVIDWSGKELSGLPEENRPENVAKKWYELYQTLLKTKGAESPPRPA